MQLSRFYFILKLERQNRLDNVAIIILYLYVIDAKSGTARNRVRAKFVAKF